MAYRSAVRQRACVVSASERGFGWQCTWQLVRRGDTGAGCSHSGALLGVLLLTV